VLALAVQLSDMTQTSALRGRLVQLLGMTPQFWMHMQANVALKAETY
jgi:plasmid maintenance system antidote protein VapI